MISNKNNKSIIEVNINFNLDAYKNVMNICFN